MPGNSRETMETGLLDYLSQLQMLDHNSLEQLWCDVRVPDAFGVDNDNWPAAADAQAGSLTAFYSLGTKQKVLTLEK